MNPLASRIVHDAPSRLSVVAHDRDGHTNTYTVISGQESLLVLRDAPTTHAFNQVLMRVSAVNGGWAIELDLRGHDTTEAELFSALDEITSTLYTVEADYPSAALDHALAYLDRVRHTVASNSEDRPS